MLNFVVFYMWMRVYFRVLSMLFFICECVCILGSSQQYFVMFSYLPERMMEMIKRRFWGHLSSTIFYPINLQDFSLFCCLTSQVNSYGHGGDWATRPGRTVVLCFCSVLCLLCLCARLFIFALWSPAGKGLTSWLSFVVSAVSLSLSHWYPGSGVVLDCIDSWSLHPYFNEP